MLRIITKNRVYSLSLSLNKKFVWFFCIPFFSCQNMPANADDVGLQHLKRFSLWKEKLDVCRFNCSYENLRRYNSEPQVLAYSGLCRSFPPVRRGRAVVSSSFSHKKGQKNRENKKIYTWKLDKHLVPDTHNILKRVTHLQCE